MFFSSLDRFRDQGLLLLRVGIGAMYMGHGGPKLLGGPERWVKLGAAMKTFGIDFAPTFWGLMAGCSEFFGGLLLVLGLFFRPALAFLAFTMFIASSMLIAGGNNFTTYSRPIEMLILMVSLILIGPGKYSLDAKWKR